MKVENCREMFTFSDFPFQETHCEGRDVDDIKGESSGKANLPDLRILSQASSPMKDGSDFRITGEFANPQEIIKRSTDFESIMNVLQELKCDAEFLPESHVTEEHRLRTVARDREVEELRENIAYMTQESAQNFLAQEGCNLLRDIGPPWNMLHNFASQTCREKSYNFLESIRSDMTVNDAPSSDESFDYFNDKFISGKTSTVTTSINHDVKSTTSGASGVSFSLYNVDEADGASSNHHKVLIDTICSISEASDKGDCNIRETSSILSCLEEQHANNLLDASDYQKLKKFIDQAKERGIVFNDLNELYNYFIQESSRERFTRPEVEIREEEDDEAETENVIASNDKILPETSEKCDNSEKAESKNVVSIFGESGIEVDGKLLDAKVSERMILGLVDKPQFEDNISDVASSVSSLSQAETVKMKENVTRETDTQTISYKEQIHSKRMHSKQIGKSKSASSIKRQPFTCKIPPLPGIGPSMDGERLEKFLRFITHRSFQQGGFVYPRNFLEDECPSMM